jgi:hypothetical protein
MPSATKPSNGAWQVEVYDQRTTHGRVVGTMLQFASQVPALPATCERKRPRKRMLCCRVTCVAGQHGALPFSAKQRFVAVNRPFNRGLLSRLVRHLRCIRNTPLASTAGRHDCACRAASETAPPCCLAAECYPRSHVVVAHLGARLNVIAQGGSQNRFSAPPHSAGSSGTPPCAMTPHGRSRTGAPTCPSVPETDPEPRFGRGPGSILAKRPPQAAWD